MQERDGRLTLHLETECGTCLWAGRGAVVGAGFGDELRYVSHPAHAIDAQLQNEPLAGFGRGPAEGDCQMPSVSLRPRRPGLSAALRSFLFAGAMVGPGRR